eukprot:UN22091
MQFLELSNSLTKTPAFTIPTTTSYLFLSNLHSSSHQPSIWFNLQNSENSNGSQRSSCSYFHQLFVNNSHQYQYMSGLL